MVFGSTRGVVLKFVKLSSSSCNKWTWKDKKHSARQKPMCKFILKGQGVFSLDVNKILRLQATLKLTLCKECNQILFFSYICWRARESRLAESVSNRVLIRDLKVLRDPWRTWNINRYSWFYHTTLRDFETQVLRIVTVVYRECLSHAICNTEPWFSHLRFCFLQTLFLM